MPKRRAHGEGGLFRRNKGTDRESWVARIYLEDGSRKELYAQTQAEERSPAAYSTFLTGTASACFFFGCQDRKENRTDG